ncbi:MAG: LLM class F420-dependent oxidoreductase, partial [Anaerolineae bacterium]
EQLGFDYVIFYDHVLGARPDREGWSGPYTHEHQFHEPLTTFAWMAALTERLEFVTSILVLPARQTALVAKQAAQIDVLSGGRLRMGVAVGWNWVEFDALGMDFSQRGRHINEQIAVLRALWTDPLVTFQGDFHHIDRAWRNPMPVQQPFPLWIGGMSEAAMRRAARLGDGWMPNPLPIDKGRERVETLHTYLREEGRDPADFGLDVRCSLRFYKEADDFRRFVDEWTPLGATHMCLNTMYVDLPSLDDHLRMLERFITAVKG